MIQHLALAALGLLLAAPAALAAADADRSAIEDPDPACFEAGGKPRTCILALLRPALEPQPEAPGSAVVACVQVWPGSEVCGAAGRRLA